MKIKVSRTSDLWNEPEEEREFLSLDDCIRQLHREEGGRYDFIVSYRGENRFSVEIYDSYRE